MLYVYVLESGPNIYVGYTSNPKARVKQHNAGQNTSTKRYLSWTLIFYEAYTNKDDATRREGYLKTSQGRQALRRMLKSHLALKNMVHFVH